MKRACIFICFICLLAGSALGQVTDPVLDNQPDEQTSVTSSDSDSENGGGDGVKYPPNSHIRLEDIETALQQFLGDSSSQAGNQDAEYAEADLQAQQDMARYTLWMFWLGLGGLFLGILGTWLIFATLRETQKTAETAREATTVARDIGQTQIRAYLAVTDCEVSAKFFEKTSDGHTMFYEDVKIVLTLNNAGQSPALKGLFFHEVEVKHSGMNSLSGSSRTLENIPIGETKITVEVNSGRSAAFQNTGKNRFQVKLKGQFNAIDVFGDEINLAILVLGRFESNIDRVFPPRKAEVTHTDLNNITWDIIGDDGDPVEQARKHYK